MTSVDILFFVADAIKQGTGCLQVCLRLEMKPELRLKVHYMAYVYDSLFQWALNKFSHILQCKTQFAFRNLHQVLSYY